MGARKKESGPRGKVLLSGFNAAGEIVFKQSLSVVDYYEELHPILDDNSLRKKQGIRILEGRIYDYDGHLDQQFKNEYDVDGAYVRGRAVHADGTIIEN